MKTSALCPLAACSLLFLSCLYASSARADNSENLFTNGKVFGEVRYRYENVKQDGLANDSGIANTARGNIGFKTGTWKNFKGLIDIQTVQNMGGDNYNDTTNGKTTYPVIADPVHSDINQLWASWSGLPDTMLKVGRQIINLDNQRFIGSVNWRQNAQAFDAGDVIFRPTDKLDLMYVDIWRVNRIFANHYTGDSNILHGKYTYADWLKVAVYDYLIDVHEAAAASNDTYGVQLTGKGPISGNWKFRYLAEYAHQTDYKNNPNSYGANYYHLTPSILWNNVTLQPGFESLGGDGTAVHVFQTPLATLHAFNGWADKFLTTPSNGLDDSYFRFAYKLNGFHDWMDGTTFNAVYHDFRAENVSSHYGNEWDLQIAKTFKTEGFVTKNVTVMLKYADYKADTLYTNTNKFWFMVDTKF